MSTSLRLTVVALMLITAAALGMIAFQSIRTRHVAVSLPAGLPAPAPLGYLVAAHPLPAGTLARDDDFVVASAPPGQAPPNVIADTPETRASLRGALIRTYIDAGKPIHESDILRPRDRGFLASVLGAGMRAISIGVDPASGVAGLIWPGDHVDVLLTQRLEQEPAARRVLAETVLTNVRVIGIDQEIVQGAPAGAVVAGKLARTVTLEVTPEQAEKVAVAEDLGQLTLTIRSATERPNPTLSTTFGSDVSAALARTDKPVGQTIQLIEGDKRTEVTFR